MKIVFVAPNPLKQKTHEGYLHRVIEIDRFFNDAEKIYLEDIPADRVGNELEQSDIIYVHSIYQADRIRSLYKMYGKKIITDLHGVVPEEELYMGNVLRSKYLEQVEEEVFRNGSSFVAVTDTMKKHFKEKYKHIKNHKWIVLPIFDSSKIELKDHHSPNVVYAGGSQVWQNVPKMVEAINARKDISATVLTYDTGAFDGVVEEDRTTPYTIKSVKASEVGKYYAEASFGFVLRDKTVVNKVACPTKLIEYLSYGVVPIVDNPEIGDFKDLGYEYITLQDFMNDSYSPSLIQDARKKNLKVVERLKTKTSMGKNKLIKLTKDISDSPASGAVVGKTDLIQDIAKLTLSLSEKNTELFRVVDENEHLREKIQEYASSVDFLSEENKSLREKLNNNKTSGPRSIVRKIVSKR